MARNTRKRLVVEERRQQLLEWGKRIFSEKPYDEVSTEEITRRVGISKGLLYHYFPGKRPFYVATIRAACEQLVRDTEPRTDVPREKVIREALGAFVAFVEENDALFRAVVRGGIGSDREVETLVEQVRSVSIDRVAAVLGITHSSPALRLAIYGWIGLVEFIMYRWSVERHLSRKVLLELLTDALEPVRRMWESEFRKRNRSTRK
ncbi:MAG: TetR/AcrR family transcriptional regulator [Planctomycetota bacterium]